MFKSILSAAALLLMVTPAHAVLFLPGPATFSVAPWSQIGTITSNTLTITNTANGFVVAGQVQINVNPGLQSGFVVAWTIDRALDPTHGTASLSTTTVLDGFSQPPAGTFLNDLGQAKSEITSYPGTSQSQITTPTFGGSILWPNLTDTGSTFTYTSGGTEFLRQTFFLDGTQTAGPGGTWIVDVPVESTINVVPEPSSLLLAGAGMVLAVGSLMRRRTNM